MQDILEVCCGLDVHKETIVACMLTGTITKSPDKKIMVFSTLLQGLNELKAWLEEEKCSHIAMESTGVYWYPVYSVLENVFNGDINIIVANARHMKNVPGKKTDMKDAEWIASLLRAGLLQGSFIPPQEFRELRDLTRYRKTIVEEMSSQKNRIEKHLQSCGFKLSTFLSDVFGVSGRAIIEHLANNGTISPSEIESCVKSRARKKLDDIKLSINGTMTTQQRDFLKLLLRHLDEIAAHILIIEETIQCKLNTYTKQVEQLDSIPGVDKTAAAAIIAEISISMNKFKTAEHICSWAGLSPGNNESAGKRKSASINRGNTYIKRILCEVGWSITHMRQTYLCTWYWKVKQRRGAKKAIVALARKLLVIIYTMFKTGTSYDESIFEHVKEKQDSMRLKRIINEAKKLGLEIALPQTA